MGQSSNPLIRQVNRDLILQFVRELQPVARAELARISGLKPSTVSSIVEQLLSESWIREDKSVKTARGRRPTPLLLNSDLLILVAYVRPLQTILAVVDINGHILCRQTIVIASDAVRGVAAIVDGLKALRERFPNKAFQGVGLGMPGHIDLQANRFLSSLELDWKEYDIAGEITRHLGLRVELQSDVNACLLSELWFKKGKKPNNVVLLSISDKLSGSILAEGRFVSGKGGLAGDFGHMCVDRAGPLCGCGSSGCWEVFAASTATLQTYNALVPFQGRLTVDELIRRALNGDVNALKALELQSREVGKGLGLITAVLAPEVILFAGQITSFWSIAEPILRSESRIRSRAAQPELRSLGDEEWAVLRGVAATVLQRHTEYYYSSHQDASGALGPAS